MNLNAISGVVLAGLLLGGCAAAPVSDTVLADVPEKRIHTGSRIATAEPVGPVRVLTSDELDATGEAGVASAIRAATPLVR